MERPFFSLAKKPRRTPIIYSRNGTEIRVTANTEHAIATIWDADILIWLITQITEQLDRGGEASPTIYFNPYTLLQGIKRDTSGRAYQRLKQALARLGATFITTNIRAPRGVQFHWIEDSGWDESDPKNVKMFITLPRWLYRGVTEGRMVLTVHEDYFKLTGGIERWLYNVVRKHAGDQVLGCVLSMATLYEKSGSEARMSDFVLDIRRIVEENSLPEYNLSVTANGAGEEGVHMVRRARAIRRISNGE
jgi:plasmid replication initiation protein